MISATTYLIAVQRKFKLISSLKINNLTANNNPYLAIFSYIKVILVILLVYTHLGVLYGLILLEIISFIFILLSHVETGENVQVSSHNKESLLAYLIPSLFSYILALISLYLAGQLYPIKNLYSPENILIKNNLSPILMTISLTIKMGLFPFFVYTLNINQGIS